MSYYRLPKQAGSEVEHHPSGSGFTPTMLGFQRLGAGASYEGNFENQFQVASLKSLRLIFTTEAGRTRRLKSVGIVWNGGSWVESG